MTVNLTRSADLDADPTFRAMVRSALIEKAIATLVASPQDKVAATALRDADFLTTVFTRIAANDSVISSAAWARNEADVRRMVAAGWAAVGLVVPNLG